MRKFPLFLIPAVILTAVFLLNTNLNAHTVSSPDHIVGRVTTVGDNMVVINEDGTQAAYTLSASPSQLVNVQTGYRVEVTTANGRISSLTVLGMPMKAEPQPFQKWTVIKYPGYPSQSVPQYPVPPVPPSTPEYNAPQYNPY